MASHIAHTLFKQLTDIKNSQACSTPEYKYCNTYHYFSFCKSSYHDEPLNTTKSTLFLTSLIIKSKYSMCQLNLNLLGKCIFVLE